MWNSRIILTAPEQHGEEHISFSKHGAHGNQSSHQHSYSKLVSIPNHGHISSHNISNSFNHHQHASSSSSQHNNTTTTVVPLHSTVTTIMSSPHAKYNQQVEVSNNLQHANRLNVTSPPTHVMMASGNGQHHHLHQHSIITPVPTTTSLKAVATSNSNIVKFPITSKGVSETKSKENQTFIVDYMFKESAGIKKSKKIKRKYEFKRKDSTVSNEVEKPQHVKVSYVIMEDEELEACGTMTELLEKYSSETNFDYSNEQQVSIVQVDSNAKFNRKRTVENITTDEMIRILHLTQQQACTLLGCSLSTIKRKFYSIRNELGIDKWPHNYLEYQKYTFFNDFYPMSLKFILNDDNDVGVTAATSTTMREKTCNDNGENESNSS